MSALAAPVLRVGALALLACLGLAGCVRPGGSSVAFQAAPPIDQSAPLMVAFQPAPTAKAPAAIQLPPSMGLPLVVTFEGPTPPAYVQAVRAAAAIWNEGLGEEVVHVGPAERGQAIVIAVEDSLEPEGPSLVYGAARRSVPGDIWRIDFSSKTPAALLQGTVVHELGHMLGLDHNRSASSVMYQRATGLAHPNAEDLRLARGGVDALKNELSTMLTRWRTQGR
jgi:hypothetical protein